MVGGTTFTALLLHTQHSHRAFTPSTGLTGLGPRRLGDLGAPVSTEADAGQVSAVAMATSIRPHNDRGQDVEAHHDVIQEPFDLLVRVLGDGRSWGKGEGLRGVAGGAGVQKWVGFVGRGRGHLCEGRG